MASQRTLATAVVDRPERRGCSGVAFYCTNHSASPTLIQAVLLTGDLIGHTRVFATRGDVSINDFDCSDWRNYIEVGADDIGKKVKGTPVALVFHTPVPLRSGERRRFWCHTSPGNITVVAAGSPAQSDDALMIDGGDGSQSAVHVEGHQERRFNPPHPTLTQSRPIHPTH